MPSFLNAMTRQIPSSSIHAATQKAEAYRREGKKVVIFSIGRPDFDTPAHIKEAAKAALDKGYVHYTPNMGILPLREAVAEHIKRQTGVSYDPKTEVMITCGGQQAILLTMKAVLEPGDEVLLPSPGYGLYYNCAAIADARVRAYALKAPDFGWGGAEAGERTKMLFINSPHNPTGAVLSKEELGQIADFAKANNLLVVSDEAYDRLLYDGLEHRSIASEPGMRDRTVILGSFSKTYSMTGWRIGYLAGPAEVIRGMALLQQSFVLSVNSFAQWGAVEAMTGPQDCVEEMRQQFDIRRKAMMGSPVHHTQRVLRGSQGCVLHLPEPREDRAGPRAVLYEASRRILCGLRARFRIRAVRGVQHPSFLRHRAGRLSGRCRPHPEDGRLTVV